MTRRRILTGWAIGLLLGVMAAGTALGNEKLTYIVLINI